MERKLVKQGRNALTVTLPAAWLAKRGLKPGNVIQVTEQEDELRISTQKAAQRVTTVNLRDAERSTVWHILSAAYVEGYDIITILHNNPQLVQEISSHLIGFVTEEHTQTKTVLKSIIQVPEENVHALLRRAGHLFVQEAHMLELIAQSKTTYEELNGVERLLDNTLIYVLRYLNKYEKQQRTHQHFLFCAWLEMAGDFIKILAVDIGKNAELAKKIAKAAEDYTEGIFTSDYKKLYSSLRTFRNSIPKKTFSDGLAYGLADMLYNNISYFVEDKKYQNI